MSLPARVWIGRVAVLAFVASVAACGDDGPPSPPVDVPSSGETTNSTAGSEPSDPPEPDEDEASADAGAALATCWSAVPPDGDGIAWADATESAGLIEPLTGMYGHAVAAGDVNGDGWTDLFVGGFADRPVEDYQVRGASGPAPDRVLLGGPDGFTVDETFPGELARSSGATFADLDADGDLDLVVVRNPRGDDEIGLRSTAVYERDDGGWTLRTSLGEDVGGRSVAAVDVDRDGLLDLVIAGDRFGAGPTRLYRNEGGLEFTDATAVWGVPDDVETLAVAVVDLDGDGRADIVSSGDTRVLLGGEDGFRVVDVEVLEWELFGEEDDPAGIAIGDLDGDGRPDLVIGQHFNSTIDDGREVPVRLLLNRSEPGSVEFVDATADAGIDPLWTKSPHVAVADLDNDGHLDIVTSAATSDGRPFVLHNTGGESLAFEPIGEPGDGTYWVTGVMEDFDHDGRLDAFMMAWEPSSVSPLFRGAGGAGAWVEIDVGALGASAPDAVVRVDDGGSSATAWAQTTQGYAAGAPVRVRFGLGDTDGDSLAVAVNDGTSVPVAPNSHAVLGAC